MNRIVITIYDYFKRRPAVGWTIFTLLTAALVCLFLTLSYKEDISDFLPLDEENHTALSVYQDISGANNIYAVVGLRDSTDLDQQELADGIESLVGNIEQADTSGLVASVTKEIDMEKMMETVDTVYRNIPYFLTDADYERIDSLLSRPGYVGEQLEADKQLLLFPSGNVLTQNISRDPLNLFTPVLGRLRNAGMQIHYETYDNYILSPDGTRAIAIIRSAFGANESEHNAELVALLDGAKARAEADNPNLDIHIIGGPAIAVGNASRIKADSMLAVVIAGILILALLIYVFRNARNIALILVSVAWGWLFAMGGIALLYDSVSIIVIGIASVILGIAINYPLHLIDHLKDTAHPRAALKEIIAPLVTGNVTTVGAFLALVPLNAPALHDLGLFASLLLVGTIIFVLVFLPHAVKTRRPGAKPLPEPKLITRLAEVKLENNRGLVWLVVCLTVVFGIYSLRTEFDSDMRNINYMTDEQRADFDYFAKVFTHSADTETVYIVSNSDSWEETLRQNEAVNATVDSLVSGGVATRNNAVSDFLVSPEAQDKRLARWRELVGKHADVLGAELDREAVGKGFNPEAFGEFHDIILADYSPKDFNEFKGLVSSVFVGNISADAASGRKSLVQTLEVKPADVDRVKNAVKESRGFDGLAFDVKSMNGSIADTLSDDFNYIGFACGCIVFFFLWFSFGSIELAIVSFLPMAVSWLWILGIMSILGIKFNIVNIILATFIFGQGDDYTIFMTEGMSYEFAYRRKLLASYKNSIIVSALIMFIGIGTLIFAKHPALRSLGEVTVVGMLSVVLMAYLFPPLAFNWLVRKHGRVRHRPVTLKKILCTGFCATVFLSQCLVEYMVGFFLFVLTRPNHRKQVLFRRIASSMFRFDIKRMPGIKFTGIDALHHDFSKPTMVISNHQSMLDSFCIMAISPNVIMIAKEHVRVNPVTGQLFRWFGFLSIHDGYERLEQKVREAVANGDSVFIFPEGERPVETKRNVSRFHKGAFQMACDLGLDIVPIHIEGLREIMPKGATLSNGGPLRLEVGKRMTRAELDAMGDCREQARRIRQMFRQRQDELHKEIFTPEVVKNMVFERYLYKGTEIERAARRNLREIVKRADTLLAPVATDCILVEDHDGEGELAMMLAMMYPYKRIYASMADGDAKAVLRGCADGFADNITLLDDDTTLLPEVDYTTIEYRKK